MVYWQTYSKHLQEHVCTCAHANANARAHTHIFESLSHLEESPEVCRGMFLVFCQIMCFCLWLSNMDQTDAQACTVWQVVTMVQSEFSNLSFSLVLLGERKELTTTCFSSIFISLCHPFLFTCHRLEAKGISDVLCR